MANPLKEKKAEGQETLPPLGVKAGIEINELDELVQFARKYPKTKFLILTATDVNPFDMSQAAEQIKREDGRSIVFVPAIIDKSNSFHPLQSPQRASLIKELQSLGLIEVAEYSPEELLEASQRSRALGETQAQVGRITFVLREIASGILQFQSFGAQQEIVKTRLETELQHALIKENFGQYKDLLLQIATFQKEHPEEFTQLLKDHAQQLSTATNQQRIEIIIRAITEATQITHLLTAQEQYAETFAKAKALLEHQVRMSTDLLPAGFDLKSVNEKVEQTLRVLSAANSLAARTQALEMAKQVEVFVMVITYALSLLIKAIIEDLTPNLLDSIRRGSAKERWAAGSALSTFVIWNALSLVLSREMALGSSLLGATAAAVIGAIAEGIYHHEKFTVSQGEIVIEGKTVKTKGGEEDEDEKDEDEEDEDKDKIGKKIPKPKR